MVRKFSHFNFSDGNLDTKFIFSIAIMYYVLCVLSLFIAISNKEDEHWVKTPVRDPSETHGAEWLIWPLLNFKSPQLPLDAGCLPLCNLWGFINFSIKFPPRIKCSMNCLQRTVGHQLDCQEEACEGSIWQLWCRRTEKAGLGDKGTSPTLSGFAPRCPPVLRPPALGRAFPLS